jgi:hypothetical protein
MKRKEKRGFALKHLAAAVRGFVRCNLVQGMKKA